MSSYVKDDIRYMSHEVRVSEGFMKPLPLPQKERTITCCGCGKTVTHVNDVPVGDGRGGRVTCPRVECSRPEGK